MFEVVGVLLVLAIPIAGVAAFFMALGARKRLSALEARLAALEGRAPSPPAARPAETGDIPAPGMPAGEPLPSEWTDRETIQPAAEAPPAAADPEAPRPVQPSAPPASFEERFGTRWVVWVGGLALALGGVFLVRYSIEQGLLGPGARIFLGALFAAALVGGGEWARRNERLSGIAGVSSAHIPSILTAAGTTVAYATVFAAYALYGFLAPPLAFLLLGIVALATLAAALLHGPALAALGLVGAYVAPLLVSTETPNYWALYIYIAVVTGAALALARARMWRWLALTAVAFGILWTLPGIDEVAPIAAHAFHLAAGFALAAVFVVAGFALGPAAEPGRIDAVSSVAAAAYVFAAALFVLASGHDGVALLVFSALVAATVAVAWRTEAASAAVAAAAVHSAVVMAHWAVELDLRSLVAAGGPAAGGAPEPRAALTGSHLALGGAFMVLFGAAGFLAQGRSPRPVAPILWAAAGVVAPITILIALYYRLAGFERSIPFAGLALLVAALYAIATEMLVKRAPRPGLATASAVFAVGGIAALALAFTFALEKGWLTVALALMVPGVAWVAEQRPVPFLRWVAAALVAAVAARAAWNPFIVGTQVGATPILNWLLWGYGVPAAAFWLGGHILRRRADDVPTRAVESAAILFTVLAVTLQIRHFVSGGDLSAGAPALAETGLYVASGLAMTIGLEWVRRRTGSLVHDWGALAVAGLTLGAIVFGLGLGANPLFSRDPVGGRFINLVLLAYGVPAVLAAVLALTTRGTRPMAYRGVAAATAVGLMLAYLTLQVRRLFQGEVLIAGSVSNAEQYAYSVVWLGFGVALLLAGILLRSQPARLASAAIVLITVGKVFLIDLSDLEGVYRALSFIGLGLVLVGIGWLYQRLVFRPPAAPA